MYLLKINNIFAYVISIVHQSHTSVIDVYKYMYSHRERLINSHACILIDIHCLCVWSEIYKLYKYGVCYTFMITHR